MSRKTQAEIEVGLQALLLHRKLGQTLSNEAIADVCGCSRNTIELIEQKALKNFRKKLEGCIP